MEVGYFGEVFSRPFEGELPWRESAEPNADMWASAEESREQIVRLYRRAWAHADAIIEALSLESLGYVSWWPEGHRDVTLHRVLVHMVSETHRHAGHADILRELLDGSAGWQPRRDNLPPGDQRWWESYRDRLEQVAQAVAKG